MVGRTPGVAALPGDMARTTAAAGESIQWTGLAPMTGLTADRAEGRLTSVPDTTLEAGDLPETRYVLHQGDLDDVIAIKPPERPRTWNE